MPFVEKPYYRKLAKKAPERFKELIKRNEQGLLEMTELLLNQFEKLKGLERILKEEQDASSQNDEG